MPCRSVGGMPFPLVSSGHCTRTAARTLETTSPDNRVAAEEHWSDKIKNGALWLPVGGSNAFTGIYENQLRSERTLKIILPLALALIFLILYLQFRSCELFQVHPVNLSGVVWGMGFLALFGISTDDGGVRFGLGGSVNFFCLMIQGQSSIWPGFTSFRAAGRERPAQHSGWRSQERAPKRQVRQPHRFSGIQPAGCAVQGFLPHRSRRSSRERRQ